jgi:O-antigen polymerase
VGVSAAKKRHIFIHYSFLIVIALMFFIAMNYTTHNLGGLGLQVPLNIATWAAACIFIFVGLFTVTLKSYLRLPLFFMQYFAFIALLLFPLFYKEYITIAGLLLALLFAVVLRQHFSQKLKTQILMILFASTLIQTCWGLLQYYFIFEPSLLFTRPDLGIPYGTFAQKNVFSTFLGFGSLLSLYFLFGTERKSYKLIIFTFVVLSLNFHLMMLAEAKTGRLVPLIAVSIYMIFIVIRFQKLLMPLMLLLVCFASAFAPKQWFNVRTDTPFVTEYKLPSTGARPVMYKIGMQMVLDKPLTGHGIGQMHKQFALAQGEYNKNTLEPTPIHFMAHIHNEPLQWMIQLGVVSGFAFIMLFIIWIRGVYTKALDPAVLLLILPFIGHSLLEYPFYHSAPHLLSFVCILSLSINGKGKRIEIPRALSVGMLLVGGYILLRILVLLWATLHALYATIDYKNSRGTQIEYLTGTPPTSTFQLTFEYEIYRFKLNQARQNGSITADELNEYIAWAENYLKHAPFELVYKQLADALMLKGDKAGALEILSEATLIFPENITLKKYYKRVKEG